MKHLLPVGITPWWFCIRYLGVDACCFRSGYLTNWHSNIVLEYFCILMDLPPGCLLRRYLFSQSVLPSVLVLHLWTFVSALFSLRAFILHALVPDTVSQNIKVGASPCPWVFHASGGAVWFKTYLNVWTQHRLLKNIYSVIEAITSALIPQFALCGNSWTRYRGALLFWGCHIKLHRILKPHVSLIVKALTALNIFI